MAHIRKGTQLLRIEMRIRNQACVSLCHTACLESLTHTSSLMIFFQTSHSSSAEWMSLLWFSPCPGPWQKNIWVRMYIKPTCMSLTAVIIFSLSGHSVGVMLQLGFGPKSCTYTSVDFIPSAVVKQMGWWMWRSGPGTQGGDFPSLLPSLC